MKALSLAAALLLAAVAVVAVHAETVHAEFPGDTTTMPFLNFSPPIVCCAPIIAGRDAIVQHAYTLDDIDRMRVAERAMATWASASNPLDSVVELRVQTDIAAGITPEDLERKITAKP